MLKVCNACLSMYAGDEEALDDEMVPGVSQSPGAASRA